MRQKTSASTGALTFLFPSIAATGRGGGKDLVTSVVIAAGAVAAGVAAIWLCLACTRIYSVGVWQQDTCEVTKL